MEYKLRRVNYTTNLSVKVKAIRGNLTVGLRSIIFLSSHPTCSTCWLCIICLHECAASTHTGPSWLPLLKPLSSLCYLPHSSRGRESHITTSLLVGSLTFHKPCFVIPLMRCPLSVTFTLSAYAKCRAILETDCSRGVVLMSLLMI